MPKVHSGDRFAVQEASNWTELHALAIAEPALQLLLERSPFRVLNVFDRSANLLGVRGEVVSIITPGNDLGPFSIMVTCPNGEGSSMRTVLPDDGEELPVKRCATELRMGRLRIATGAAELWNPQLANMSLCGLELEECLGSIDTIMNEHASHDSLWHLFSMEDPSPTGDRMRLAWRHLLLYS